MNRSLTMNEQHQEVQIWLDTVFGGEPVPAYELNKHTVGILYNLMRQSERQDKDTQLIIDDLRQKAEEYRSEANRTEEILSCINLTIASLSQSGVISLRTLANLALLLQLKNTSDTSYMLGLQALEDELYKTEEEIRNEQRNVQQLVDKTKVAILQHNNLKRALQVLEQQSANQQPEIERAAKETSFLRSKGKQYKEDIHRHQNYLTKSGADPSIYHRELVKKSEELQILKDKIAPMKTKLETYHSLPPDISLAKVKIEEMKREVDVLQAEICKRIDLMHM